MYLKLRQLVRGVTIAKYTYRLARAADFRQTAASIDIGLPQKPVDLTGGHAQRLHLDWIKQHFDFAANPAKAIYFSHAFNRKEPFRNRVIDEPAQLLNRHVIGFDRIDTEKSARNVHPADPGFQNAIRQCTAHRVDRVLHISDSHVRIDADFKLDKGAGATFARSRTDIAHTVQRSHSGFDLLRYLVFNFSRSCAWLRDGDIDARKIDVGIINDVHPRKTEQARNKQRGKGNQRDDRVADRPGGDVPH